MNNEYDYLRFGLTGCMHHPRFDLTTRKSLSVGGSTAQGGCYASINRYVLDSFR